MKLAFASRARATRVFLPVALAGVLVVSDVAVAVCVKRSQTYVPGFDAIQLYRPGTMATETYRPGVDASQEECC